MPTPTPAGRRSGRPSHVLLTAVALAAVPSPSSAVPPGEFVAALNRDREAHGLPGGIVEDPRLSAGCALHNAYLHRNPGGDPHREDPALPGHTPQGDEAGRTSVLYEGPAPAPGIAAFRTAPLHLMHLLNPRLAVTGVDDTAVGARHRLCVVTLDPRLRDPAPEDLLLPFPGDGRAVAASEVVMREYPHAPGDLVGLPQGTSTGPHLYVLADGPWVAGGRRVASVVRAALTGPEGPVEVRALSSADEGMRGYVPQGAVVIPVGPLASGPHTAEVALANDAGVTVSRRWTFTAEGGRAPAAPVAAEPARAPDPPRVAAQRERPAEVRVVPRRSARRATIRVRVRGRVAPPRAGVPVLVERRAGRRHVRVCRGRTGRGGVFAFRCTVRGARPGASVPLVVRVPGRPHALRALRVTTA